MIVEEKAGAPSTAGFDRPVRPSGKLRRALAAAALAIASVLGSLALPTAAHAGPNGYSHWDCWPSGDYWEGGICTVVAGAPSTGVRVMDQTNYNVVTWYNGTSVKLYQWSKDTSGKCGVKGDPYVWVVEWYSNGVWHWGYIGDYYLATGSASQWQTWTTPYGDHLGDTTYRDYDGYGSGYCNEYSTL